MALRVGERSAGHHAAIVLPCIEVLGVENLAAECARRRDDGRSPVRDLVAQLQGKRRQREFTRQRQHGVFEHGAQNGFRLLRFQPEALFPRGVAQLLTVRVGEAVYFVEEEREDAAVAEFEEGVAEDVAEKFGELRAGFGVADGFDTFGEKGDALVAGNGQRQEGAPAVFRERAGEAGALAAHRHGLLVEVVHELVDEGEADELDLIGREGECADEEVAARVEAALMSIEAGGWWEAEAGGNSQEVRCELLFGFGAAVGSGWGMAHNPRLGFHPSLAARAAAARDAAKAGQATPGKGPAAVVREELKELRLCGLAAVQARFARDPGSIQRLFYEAALGQRVGAICKVLAVAKKVYRQVDAAELEKVAGSLHHGGVVAVVMPEVLRVPTSADIREWAKRGEVVLVLDRIGNAHNLGAIARTAAFFGVARIVIPDHANAAKPTESAHRVAEGGLEVVEVWQTRDLVGCVRELGAAGYEVVGAATRGGRPEVSQGAVRKPLALVLGNEEHGLTPVVAASCARLVTIPGSGKIESLNVSVAAAVLLWELLGRRAG